MKHCSDLMGGQPDGLPRLALHPGADEGDIGLLESARQPRVQLGLEEPLVALKTIGQGPEIQQHQRHCGLVLNYAYIFVTLFTRSGMK